MLPDPPNTSNTFAILIPSTNSEAPPPDKKKCDPALASIFVAALGLIGVLGVALIGKVELFLKDPKIEQVVVLQEEKHKVVMAELSDDLKQIEMQKEAVTRRTIPSSEKVRLLKLLDEAKEATVAASSSVETQFPKLKEKLRSEDKLGELETRNIMNQALSLQRLSMQSAFAESYISKRTYAIMFFAPPFPRRRSDMAPEKAQALLARSKELPRSEDSQPTKDIKVIPQGAVTKKWKEPAVKLSGIQSDEKFYRTVNLLDQLVKDKVKNPFRNEEDKGIGRSTPGLSALITNPFASGSRL